MISKRMAMTNNVLMSKLVDMHNTNLGFIRTINAINNSCDSPGCKELEISKALRQVNYLLEDHEHIAKMKLGRIDEMSFPDEEN